MAAFCLFRIQKSEMYTSCVHLALHPPTLIRRMADWFRIVRDTAPVTELADQENAEVLRLDQRSPGAAPQVAVS